MKTLRLLAAAMFAAGFLGAVHAESLTPAVAVPLKAAGDDLRAHKAKEALAEIRKADAVGGKTAYDTYMINRLRGSAAQLAGDNSTAANSLEAAFNSGKMGDGEKGQVAESIAFAYSQMQANAKAKEWAGKATALGNNSASLRQLQAYLQGASGDYSAIARDSAGAIQSAEQAGRRPGEDDLLRLADAYRHTGNKAGDLQVKEKLVTYYPTKQYVGIYLSDIQGKSGFSSRYSIDVLRLRLATGNAAGANDFMELAQLLLQAGLPSEAKAVVDKGYAAGVLGTGAEAARQQRLRDLTNKNVAEEKASIAKRAAEALSTKDGNDLVTVGVEYASMGEYDKGIDLIQQGIAKDKLKYPEEAKLRLGVAMLQSGKNKAAATKALRAVQGTDGAPEVARLYIATSSMQ
jgi:hypothetical protein